MNPATRNVVWEKYPSQLEPGRSYYLDPVSRTATWIVPVNHPDHHRYHEHYPKSAENTPADAVVSQHRTDWRTRVTVLWSSLRRSFVRFVTSTQFAMLMLLLGVLMAWSPSNPDAATLYLDWVTGLLLGTLNETKHSLLAYGNRWSRLWQT
jgi:DNA-binding transcriptional LysR family regulator